MKQLRVISLGWGVQSWTLAAMAALGEIEPVDYAIHADTTHEMSGTYQHAAKWTPWLEEHGVKVRTVQGRRMEIVRADWKGVGIMIPAFTLTPSGQRGQTQRQCTAAWKIAPIRRFIRTVILQPARGCVESLQGISLDEFQRMRTSDVAYIVNTYPLVDKRMTRADCAGWLQAHGLDLPVKSACTFCPFHRPPAWQALKRAGGPDWAEAVEADEAIRNRRDNHKLFVHEGRKPLAEAVDIPEDHGARQMGLEEAPCDSGFCWT